MSQLLSWSPEALEVNGQALTVKARDMQRVSGVLVGVKAAFTASWVGEAADAAIAHVQRRITELDEFAEVVYSTGTTLVGAGGELALAQAALQRALAAAAASGSAVADDGTVSPPALPAVPAGLAGAEVVAWVGQAEREASSVAAGLAGQVAAALDAAATADGAGASALAALNVPVISPPAKPVRLTVVNGQLRPVPAPLPDPPEPAPLPPPPAPPAAPEPEPEEDRGFWSKVTHTALDVAGLVPVIGEPADLANATLYAVEGDEVNAAISMAAMVPVAGGAVVAAKYAKKGADAAADARRAADVADEAERAAVAAAAARKALVGAGPGGAGRVLLGQAGEAAVRANYAIGPKASQVVDGRKRIFDGLNRQAVSEVKHVEKQSLTQQLKDSVAYAQRSGRRLDLYVRPDTQLSGPLLDAIRNGSINLRFIP